ncbi:DNA-packaging protein [Vibrio phage 1.197.A._10N.286.54.F2]|nr:DNA-packaging protein [Vibrio phage 1.197.A._10N.286.54.F2]
MARPKNTEDRIWNEVNPFGRKSQTGRGHLRFETPEQLWEEACEYFEWALNTPWKENKAMKMKSGDSDVIEYYNTTRPRYLSNVGLCLFLGIQRCTYGYYQTGRHDKDGKDYASVCAVIDDIIHEQKLSGAAAGIFHPMIVARELGLADKQEISHEVTDDFDALMGDAADND